MKKILLAFVLVGGSAVFGQISIGVGVNIGSPAPYFVAPPRPVYVVPPSPGYGYVWVPGYYVPKGKRQRWTSGYWMRPPRRGAVWVAPRYYGKKYYRGYWR